MHQTFYIDVDEEISSVIDRLNKSMSVDNYFVVPKRALFLQSIVNLKILKREADKVGKRVILVTQDEIGISMAERCDVMVIDSLDGLEPKSDLYLEEEIEIQEEIEMKDPEEEMDDALMEIQDKRMRLNGVGTSDFYATEPSLPIAHALVKTHAPRAKVAAKKNTPIKKVAPVKVPAKPVRKQIINLSARKKTQVKMDVAGQLAHGGGKNLYQGKLDPSKAQKLEKIFSAAEPKQEKVHEIPVRGKTKKIFFGFVVLCLLAFVGVAAFVFVPSAKVIITPNVQVSKVDLDIKGETDIDAANGTTIPNRVFPQDEQIAFTYDMQGQNEVQGKKATGTVTIYNEYSDSPQTLIATTRLQSQDGKIFHLVKNVVVPGAQTVGGQTQAGSAQADVVADQAGEDYNIDTTKFTIPGFAGGPKFDKFYAESKAAFTGGTTEQQTGAGKVAQQDIDSAKQKAEDAFKAKALQDINDNLSQGEIVLPQAQKITISSSKAAVKVGATADTFDYNVTGTVTALVFSENDVKKLIEQSFKSDQQAKDSERSVSKVEYGNMDADFGQNTFDLKVHGEITTVPNIDADKLKSQLLGKSDEDLATVIKSYPAIKNANIEFQPSFISRIPQFSQRVDVQIKQ